MKQLLKKVLMAATISALGVAPALADGVFETEAVTVTVNRTEQALHDVNVSAGIVTEEDIRRNPSTSIADHLLRIPGVTLEDGGMAGGKRVSIRGEGSSRVLMMIDGVKISEQKSMSGAAILIDPSNIERIEVIKGPASVLYGSEAIGGVVNIITKKGGDKPIGGTAQLTYDSATNSFEPFGAVAGSYDGFNYRVSGSYQDAGDRQTPHGHLDDTGFIKRNFSAQAGYDWSWGGAYAQVDYYRGTINIPGTDLSEGSSISTVSMGLPKWERTTYKTGVEFNNFNDYLLRVKVDAYYQNMIKDFYNHISSLGPSGAIWAGVEMDVLTYNDQDSYGGTVQTEWLLLDDHFVTLGVDYNRDDLDAKGRNSGVMSMYFNPAMPPMTTVNIDTNKKYDGHMDNIGVFLQDEWSITDQWKLVGGLRYTHVNTKMRTDDTIGRNSSEADDNVVGNVGVVFEPMRELALRANFSQGYRSPTLNQLYIGTSGHGGATTYANPDLKPEKSNNYEIGARWNSGNVNIDAAVYYADAKDYITTTPYTAAGVGNTDVLIYTNLDKARTWGFELGADYTFVELGLSPYVVFNYIQRETKNSGFKTKHNDLAPVQGMVGIKWQRDLFDAHTFFADLNYTYNSRSKYDYMSEDVLVKTKNGSWGTVNLSMGFESHYDDCVNYFGTLALRNLFNEEYRYSRSTLIEPGFHVVTTFGITY